MRDFKKNKVWILELEAYNKAVEFIVEKLKIKDGNKIDSIIGIARGGRIFGQDLSFRLETPYYEIKASSNLTDNIYSETRKSVRVDLDSISSDKIGKNILLVDDICGSGQTILSVVDFLKTRINDIVYISTCVLCLNKGSSITPDYYLWEVDEWVVFPWEPLPQNPIIEKLVFQQ